MALTLSAPTARRAGALTLIGVTAAALSGCSGGGVPARLDFSDVEKVKVTEIVIGAGSGDVKVHTSPIGETRIKRTVQYRGAEPGKTYSLNGTILQVDTNCGHNCSVSYDIEAPTGVAISGEVSSGDLTLTDVAAVKTTISSGNVQITRATGAVEIDSRSGDITVTDPGGAVRLNATSGNIRGRGLGAGPVNVEATSGDITLQLATAGSVTTHATSGNLELTVPTGAYQVRADASSGDKKITVTNDPAAKNILDASANSGDITITQG
jgi:hypothetical protein